jgi:hypothetical protein
MLRRAAARSSRRLVLAVAVGVGIGFLASGGDSSASVVDPEVDQFLDEYWAAWNAYDADAIRAMATDGAVLGERDLTATGALSLEALLDDLRADGEYSERLGDPIVRDNGAQVDVAQYGLGGMSEGNEDDSIWMLRLVREDGTLKVEWDRVYDCMIWRGLGL